VVKLWKNIRRWRKIGRKYTTAGYRVKGSERRKKRKLLRLKLKARREVRILWSDLGLRFWYPKPVVLKKKNIVKSSPIEYFW